MKKIITFFLLFFSFLWVAIACSIPPDILNRFYIYEENNNLKINYSLFSWDDFLIKIQKDFEEKNWKKLNSDNIKTFIENNINKVSKLTYNWKKIDLKFESVRFFSDYSNWDPLLEIKFWTNISWLKDENIFKIIYEKKEFSKITDLIHTFFYSKIEEELNFDWFTKIWEERFDNYFYNGIKYWLRSYIEKENNDEIIYIYKLKKLWEDKSFLKEKKSENKSLNPILENQNKNFLSWIRNYFENLLKRETTVFEKIFWIIFAIIFWALHWLLPWHSKSIVWAYVVSNEKKSKNKELFVLILTITITHSLFLFILAFLINIFNLWVWTWTSYAHKLWSILYIIFWIYFTYFAIKNFIKKEKHSHCSCSSCCSSHNHKENIYEKKSLKKSIWVWIIFWFVPCIDALVLFLFALSIWNILYASFIVLAFSLGLWIMLWILAILVWKWYNFISKKNTKIVQKILNILIFILWIFIIIFWIFWLI